MILARVGVICNQDPFPQEDIVWGTLRINFASPSLLPFHRGEAVQCSLSDLNEVFYMLLITMRYCTACTPGVAFTIDPAHATEVRAYLGT
jgi:hypothetical protein